MNDHIERAVYSSRILVTDLDHKFVFDLAVNHAVWSESENSGPHGLLEMNSGSAFAERSRQAVR